MNVLSALGSGRTWRATLHALAGLPLGVGGGALIVGLVTVWLAAIWSLFDGPGGDWRLVVLYVLMGAAGPVLLLGIVWLLSAVQRARFARVLGIRIAAPPRAWRSPATWRQLGYHLLALITGTVGGAVVAICWSAVIFPIWYGGRWLALTVPALALILAAPWVARGVARVDVSIARALLGPSRTDELTERVESLARSRADVIAATDAERRRIERDLHDGAQQRLLSLAMNLGMARATLTDAAGPARQAIESAHDEATQALAELREFVRGLHPAVLNDRGLDAALSGIAARAPLPVRLRVDAATRCSPSIEAIAYFVVSEALTNVARHAHASHAEVTVHQVDNRLRVVVTDDGQGGATPDSGSGLRGLAQRTAAVDGTLTIHSPPGGPTTITAELPCES